jgi:hypothetical protein
MVARTAPPPPPASFNQRQMLLQQNPGQPLNRAQVSQIQQTQPPPARPAFRPALPQQTLPPGGQGGVGQRSGQVGAGQGQLPQINPRPQFSQQPAGQQPVGQQPAGGQPGGGQPQGNPPSLARPQVQQQVQQPPVQNTAPPPRPQVQQTTAPPPRPAPQAIPPAPKGGPPASKGGEKRRDEKRDEKRKD